MGCAGSRSVVLEKRQQELICVTGVDTDPQSPYNWPGRQIIELIITTDMCPILRMDVTGVAEETVAEGLLYYPAATKMVLVLLNSFGETKQNLSINANSFQRQNYVPDQFIEAIVPGDVVKLWAVLNPTILSPLIESFTCFVSGSVLSITVMNNDGIAELLRRDGNILVQTRPVTEQHPTQLEQNDLIRNWGSASQRNVENTVTYIVGQFLIPEVRCDFYEVISFLTFIPQFCFLQGRVREVINLIPNSSLMNSEELRRSTLDYIFRHPQPEERINLRINSISSDEESTILAGGIVFTTEKGEPASDRAHSSLPRNISYDISCCVCFEEYNDRVSTRCGHFFCRACIVSYMSATVGDGPSKCLCPMCRRPVLLADLCSVPVGVCPSDVLYDDLPPDIS